MTRARTFSLLVLLIVASTAWSQRVPRILNGEEVPRILNGEETDLFPSVGAVGSIELAGEFCTGTLISPRHVLTAAHCAEVLDNHQDATFRLGDRVFRSSRVFFHPDFNSRTLANDLAILELEESVPDVVPSSLFEGVPRVGDVVTLVGFGSGGDGNGGDGTFGIKRVGTTTLDRVTDLTIEWVFDSNDESNTAAGDSGGPNYILADGAFHLAGVTSGGTEPDAGLGDRAFNTRVDAYLVWIDLIIDSAPPQEDDPGQDDPEQDDPEQDDPETGDRPGHKPGHRPGNKPGYRPGHKPGYRPGNKPGYRPGHKPGYRPGNKPGYRPGYRPPQLRPGHRPGHRPGQVRPGHRPGHRPPQVRPGNRRPGHSANRPDRRPAQSRRTSQRGPANRHSARRPANSRR